MPRHMLPCLPLDLNTQAAFFGPQAEISLVNGDVVRVRLRELMAAFARAWLPILSGLDAHLEGDDEFRAAGLAPHALPDSPGRVKLRETSLPGAYWVPVSGHRRPWPNLDGLRRDAGQMILEKRA